MAQKELDVNVHQHALRAAQRVNGAKTRLPHSLQDTEDRSWFKRLFPQAEALMVNARQVSGFVVPHWAAGVLLASMLGAVAFLYTRIDSQRDMLIEMKTEMRLSKEHETEYRHEFKNTQDLQQIYINNLTSELKVIKTFLTPQQMRQIEQTRKVDN